MKSIFYNKLQCIYTHNYAFKTKRIQNNTTFISNFQSNLSANFVIKLIVICSNFVVKFPLYSKSSKSNKIMNNESNIAPSSIGTKSSDLSESYYQRKSRSTIDSIASSQNKERAGSIKRLTKGKLQNFKRFQSMPYRELGVNTSKPEKLL